MAIDFVAGTATWSDEVYHLLGLDKTLPASMELYKTLIPEAQRGRFDASMEAVRQGLAQEPREVTIVRPDGQERTIYREVEGIRDEAGRVVGAIASLRDITARKHAEIQLHDSQRHLERAQRIAGVGSMEIDFRTGAWKWSDQLYLLLGLSKDLPPSTELYCSVLPEAERASFAATAKAIREGLAGDAREITVTRPDGQVRTIYREVEGIRDEAGRVIGGIASLRDVTERKRIEAALHDNEARLRRSQEHLKTAQRVAAVGSFEHRFGSSVIEWSEETYRIFGIDLGTAITPERLDAMVFEEDRDRVRDTLRLAREGQPIPAIEYRIRRSSGEVRTLYRDCEALRDAAGAPIGIIGVCRDVTEWRAEQQRNAELEAQLHHAQRMEALGTLAGGIAHDLNNTLLPVMILAQAVLRKLPEGADRERLQLILQAAERARGLVRRVLAFSRREDPNKAALDLAALLHESMGMVRAGVPTTVTIEERIASVSAVLGDAGQLHQVLLNLIGNAIDAIGDGIGTITLELQDEMEAPAAPGGTVRPSVHLSVSDTGSGMDAVTLKRIFEPFFTTKDVGQGTGLGLSVVHGIVSSHGGRIEATSQPGQGSRFDIFLPALRAEQIEHIDKEAAA
jgi:PAS domain S-box-containing protein